MEGEMPPSLQRRAGRRRHRSQRSGLIALIVLITLPLLVLTGLIAWRGARGAEARVRDERRALAQASALTTSSWLESHTASLQTVARTPDVVDPYNRPDLPGFLRSTLTDHPEWETIDILSPQGVNLASTHDDPGALDLSDSPQFRRALGEGRLIISPASISARSARPIVTLMAPVDFVTGVRGAIRVTLLTVRLNEVLRSVPDQEHSRIVLVDDRGQEFANSEERVVISLTALQDHSEVAAVLAGRSGVRRAPDPDGADALIAYAPVPLAGWGVLVSEPVSAALGPARRQLTEELVVLVMAAILTGTIGWYLASRLSGAYAREVEALARAEDAGRLREEFLASATHDLKNPLTAIKALAQLIKRRAEQGREMEPEWIAEGLSSIDSSATRMLKQINELMDLAHLQTDRPLELNRAPVDLVDLVRATASQQHHAARDRIRIEGDDSLIGEWDRARLERVLDNLIGNAIKYSPNGGDIVLTVCREPSTDGDTAVLSVRDRGLGIPAADLPRVFDRFHRGGNVVGRVAGTGIGLAGVRQIVEQHGGVITVESREGAGSTFTVRLPVSACDEGEEDADMDGRVPDAAPTLPASDAPSSARTASGD
jgi:signal transduction histidine kinase